MGRSETTPRAEEKAMPRKQGDKQTMGVGQGREGNAEQARERAERKDRTGINGAPNARDEANGRRGEIESTGRSVARGNITPEMRTRVRSEIPNIQVRSAPDLNVDVRVGGVLPRTVTEYWEPIPADIVTIVPEWRAYRIVKVGGEILVIDPDTFEIVDVLSG
ncbi:Protein of unknown function [Methylocapsa palsarum]|uniref:DUF1236 domain-containing protein n=2 Tax=Methylocapsa palsarum TaxID=1612308 RepID=A0A1I4CY97_9HYPH|nr:Protein of unknown function [Methylocapsa palsarum]